MVTFTVTQYLLSSLILWVLGTDLLFVVISRVLGTYSADSGAHLTLTGTSQERPLQLFPFTAEETDTPI